MKKNLWILTTVIVLWIAVFSIDAFSATLFEANWDVGSTCSADNIRSGAWAGSGGTGAGDCANPCACYDIGTGGIGGRNYLVLKMMNRGSGNVNGNISLDNPATLYVRLWFRMIQYVNSQHPVYLNSSTYPSAGVCLLRGYNDSLSIIPGTGAPVYFPNFNINLNQWYLFEVKITGGGTSNGVVLVRLNGADITANMNNYVNGRSLSADNGSFTIPSINNINIENYDKAGYSGPWLHIARLKITDGPNWIGGGEAPNPPKNLVIISN